MDRKVISECSDFLSCILGLVVLLTPIVKSNWLMIAGIVIGFIELYLCFILYRDLRVLAKSGGANNTQKSQKKTLYWEVFFSLGIMICLIVELIIS